MHGNNHLRLHGDAGPRSQSGQRDVPGDGKQRHLASAVTGTTGTGSYCVQDARLHFVTLDARAANGIGSDIVGEKR